MKRLMMLVLALALLLSLHMGAMASADYLFREALGLMSERDERAFAQAIEEDRLALKAVALSFTVKAAQFQAEADRFNAAVARYEETDIRAELPKAPDTDGLIRLTLDDLYAASDYLSMSMDGNSLLTIADSVPYIYHLDAERVTVLAPDESVSQAYYDMHYRRNLEHGMVGLGTNDGGFEWSPDGKYILMSSSKNVLMNMRFGSNTLLADIAKGTIRPIDAELPVDASIANTFEGGYPFRATFHPSEPIAYVEYYGVSQSDHLVNQIKAYNLNTGSVKVVSEYPANFETADPGLWYTRLGLAESVRSTRRADETNGLAFRGIEREDSYFITANKAEDRWFYGPNLIAMAGGRGIILNLNANNGTAFPANPVQLFVLDKLDPALLETALVVYPQESPDRRLHRLPFTQEDMDAQGVDRQWLFSDDSLRFVANGALSPDGRYALLTVAKAYPHFTDAVYLYDIDRGLLSKVSLPDIQPFGDMGYLYLGFYHGPNRSPVRGIRWLNNNRLLIVEDGNYRLFELVIQ